VLAQDRDRWRALVSTVKNIRFPKYSGKFLTSCRLVSFSRRTLLNGVSATTTTTTTTTTTASSSSSSSSNNNNKFHDL
jgi:hypothetical protein